MGCMNGSKQFTLAWKKTTFHSDIDAQFSYLSPVKFSFFVVVKPGSERTD